MSLVLAVSDLGFFLRDVPVGPAGQGLQDNEGSCNLHGLVGGVTSG